LIAFGHGALRGRAEKVLAAIVSHAVLPWPAAQAISFLSEAERLAPPDWSIVLAAAANKSRDVATIRALVRLRDALADSPVSVVMSHLNDRIERISEGRAAVRAALTAASYGLLLQQAIGDRNAAALRSSFEPFIPQSTLG